MAIHEFESPGAWWDKEHRHSFSDVNPSWSHVMVSGSTLISGAMGEPGDEWVEDDFRLIVGPYWKDVRVVVPFVTVNGFENDNWDGVDKAGWNLHGLEWDTWGPGSGPHQDEERVRLKFKLRVKGKDSFAMRVAYHFMAAGRALGHLGLDAPDPGQNTGT